MADKKELLNELKEKFEEAKKELGFNASFEELDSAFFIKDAVLSIGFVSDGFSRQLCSRIIDTFNSWHSYLNGLMMPSSSFFASQTEAKLFNTPEDKKIIWSLIKKAMYLSSKNSIIGMSKDKNLEKEFIDEAYISWRDFYCPGILKILQRVNEGWKKE